MATPAVLSRLSTFRISSKLISSLPELFKSSSQSQSSATIFRVSRPARLPAELSCCSLTMMPLHSAIASARLCSDLSKDSQSWNFNAFMTPSASSESIGLRRALATLPKYIPLSCLAGGQAQ
ncbi:hypothetical protein AKJ16_DCAP01780 [Drosera capensis]